MLDKVKHLGVYISRDYSTGKKLTFEEGKSAMMKSMNRVPAGIVSTNLLMNAQAVYTSAINNHCLRVYPPSTKEIKESWKQLQKTLGTILYQT